MSVLTDRTITKLNIALKLEMTEHQWVLMSDIITVLKPLNVATTVLCSENQVTISLVLPIIHSVIKNHLNMNITGRPDTEKFKNILVVSLTDRFNLNSNKETVHSLASFLDPRSKQLTFEDNEKKNLIKIAIDNMIENLDRNEVTENENVNYASNSALDFIFHNSQVSINDSRSELDMYIQDTEINHNLSPLEWWKTKEGKYPRLAKIAKKYLCIPATSASSERVFSTAGNIVTSKRTCLLPENVDLLVFLHKNKNA